MRHSLAFRRWSLIYLLISIFALLLLLLARPAHGQVDARFVPLPPLGSALSLRLDLRGPAEVRWNVFDMGGRRVASRDYGTLGGGAHPIIWDGRDRHGCEVRAGTYWIQIQAGDRLIARMVDL